jgi:molybdopterin-guanine dinucleotide biosynthesis protein A
MRAEIITLRDGAGSPFSVSAGVTGVVLTSGRDERFGGMDRGLIRVGERPLVKRVLEQLVLQVKQILIVAREHESLYSAYGYRVIPDGRADSRDALPAVVNALGVIETTHALFVPADAARLPLDLNARLWQAHARRGDVPCFVQSGDRPIVSCCLVAKSERASAEQALASGRTLGEWLASRQAIAVDFTAWPAAFWGIASPSDIAPLEAALRR